ncbi:MAG: hypothetical protein EA349_06040 [Halomonadaceae bacterium]|nr:MAG: hypothetical protein EA349_06040 [Halomonadaceae bacterium]
MCPESCPQSYGPGKQQGVGLPMAIFLITVMALLVTTIAQLQQTSGETAALDILSTRAFYAAESGAQLAMTQFLAGGEAVCQSVGPFTFSEAGLANCSAIISCEFFASPELEPVIQVVSEGRCGSGNEQTFRTVEVLAQ